MKKYIIIYALAITVSFTAFAQEASSKQDRFMKINEPYVFMSFLGNNDMIAGMQLPDWSVGLGDRYTCLHKPTGLSFDLDAGVEYGFLKKTDKNDCFSASARIALSFGYSYFFSKTNPVTSLSLSVGIGTDYSMHVFSPESSTVSANLPEDMALGQSCAFVPVRLKLLCEDISLAMTYRFTFAQKNDMDAKLNIIPFEISAGIPLDIKKVRNAYLK